MRTTACLLMLLVRRFPVSVAALLPALLLVGCNTNVEQMVEDAGRSSPVDSCPDDPEKTSPGLCGCGFSDANSDGDRTPDCRDGCPNDPEKTAPGECGCGAPETCNALTLLVRPVDEIVVLSDLSVWDVGRFLGIATATRWAADDPIEEYTPSADSDADFALRNLRTNDVVGADFIGVGSMVTVIGFQEQEPGHRLITFDDGSTWGFVLFSDEVESRTWRTGEDVVIYQLTLVYEAINLRTGRVVALDPTSSEPKPPPTEPEPPPTEPEPFVSGDVFTFLTPDETDYFLSRVRVLNDAILGAYLNELAAAAAEDASRGLRGGGAASATSCQLSQDAVRARREGTWVALQDVADTVGKIFPATASEVQEVDDFNRREYPCPTCLGFVLPC